MADEQNPAGNDATDDDRPKPYPHEGDNRVDDDASDSAEGDSDSSSESDNAESDNAGSDGSGESDTSPSDNDDFSYGEDETQDFVDRDVIDFDPADGLYTGSAVTGESDIPGPSESEIREAQEDLGDDEDGDAGAKKAAEKFIEDNDVDLEEAQKGEAIAGSAQSSGDKGDDT